MGYIKIDDEAIFYQQLQREGPKAGSFEMCQRGREMTLPKNHMTGANIELWSIAISNIGLRGSRPRPSSRSREEWFGPVTPATGLRGVPQAFWVGCPSTAAPSPSWRGMDWLTPPPTNVRFHEPDELLMPLFAAREVDSDRRRTNMGRYDSVTVINADYEKEAHTVCHAISAEEINQWHFMQNPQGGNPPPPPRDTVNQGIQLTTLFMQTRHMYPVDHVYNRVIKFPSGELLDQRWLATKNPGVAYGPAKATIDEVKNVATIKGDFLLDRLAPPEMKQLNLDNPTLINANQQSGIVVAGEEIIGYAKYDGVGQFLKCKRGWLNTTAQIHNQGDPVFLLNFLPVAAVGNQQMDASSRMLTISQALVGQGYTRGYALVDNEVIGFEEIGLKGVDLDSLATFEGSGLFRGMFGTTAADHASHAMVFGIPFRYWDGYKRGQFDNRMPYFSVAQTTRDARWREFRYQIETGQNDINLLPHGYLRVDGLGHFTIPSVEEHSAVWHFYKSQKNPLDDYISSRLENGQIEARFFLEYKQGSYWPQDSWKRTMKIHEIRIDYDRDPTVLMHEDK
jgi:hypothetical protein